MNFLRSRSEQLADFLRERIVRRELVDPLPDSRAWSRSLGVSRNTLFAALRILQREGFLASHGRKAIRLQPQDRWAPRETSQPKIVRIVHYGHEYPDFGDSISRILALVEHLRVHDIQLTLEKCTASRLQRIAREAEQAHDLLFLQSLLPAQQKLFGHLRRRALVLGYPALGVSLPYVVFDLVGTIRHAAQFLLRQGCQKLSLVLTRSKAPGIPLMIESFHHACSTWPHQPTYHSVVQVPPDPTPLLSAVRQFAARAVRDQGIIVVSPVPVAAVTTALWEAGVALPKDASLIAVMTSSESVKVCPQPIHYPFPVELHAKILAEAAVHYFQTGALPPLRRELEPEFVRVS